MPRCAERVATLGGTGTELCGATLLPDGRCPFARDHISLSEAARIERWAG